MKAWYTITAAAGDKPAEINIFDRIGATWDGEGVTAKKFIADLKAITAGSIMLFVNSPGGSLFDGVAIHNALKAHPATITAKVMGVAASAASVIVMGADSIEMPANTFLMIHKSASGAFGNADDMRAAADMLDKVDTSMGAIYANRTGKTADEIAQMLADETWLTAEEAVEMGFADKVTDDAPVTASYEIDKLPERVQAALKPPAPPQPPLAVRIKAAVEAAGLGDHVAVFALDPKLDTLEIAKLAINEAVEIKELAAIAGKPEMAASLIGKRTSLADARAALVEARATESDTTHVDTTPPVDPKQAVKPAPAAEAFGPTSYWAAQAA